MSQKKIGSLKRGGKEEEWRKKNAVKRSRRWKLRAKELRKLRTKKLRKLRAKELIEKQPRLY